MLQTPRLIFRPFSSDRQKFTTLRAANTAVKWLHALEEAYKDRVEARGQRGIDLNQPLEREREVLYDATGMRGDSTLRKFATAVRSCQKSSSRGSSASAGRSWSTSKV